MDKLKIKKYFYENLSVMFWSVFLLLGGGVFVAYYAYIGYMPDFDLSSSVAVTAAASVTALIITVMLLAVMVIPGVFWGNTFGKESMVRKYWIDEKGVDTFVGVLLWFIIPTSVVLISLYVSYFIGWYAIFVLLLIGIFFPFIKRELPIKKSILQILFLYSTSIVSALLIFIPIYLILSLSINPGQQLKVPLWMATISVSLLLVFVNVLAASTPKNIKPIYWYIALSVVALYIMLFVFEKSHRIPERVMEIYKFGNISTSELVLRKDACDVFNALNISIDSSEHGYCVAKNIVILSRLGREAYLQYSEENILIRFSVKSESILSWSVRP